MQSALPPLPYKGKKESSVIKKILYKKRVRCILRKRDNGTKSQLISNILELLRFVRKNHKHPELQNVRIVDDKAEYFDKKWHEVKTHTLVVDAFVMLQEHCIRARTPLSELVSREKKEIDIMIKREDPLQMIKHLDSFVNNDDGYNWEGERLLERDEMIPHVIAMLTLVSTTPFHVPPLGDPKSCTPLIL
jgi:hypothetical protein